MELSFQQKGRDELLFFFLNQAMDTSKKYPISDRLVLSSQSMFPKSLLGQ